MSADGLTLVVDRRHLSILLDNKTLRMDYLDGSFQRVPVTIIANVVIYGNPSIRCDVWRALADANVPVAILPIRGQGDVCWLGSGLASYAHVRQKQFYAYQQDRHRLEIARWVVQQKLASQGELLKRLGATVALTQWDQLQTNITHVDNLAQLLGFEGHAAATHFESLKTHIAKPWGFTHRNRRPPQDPINALLSLGYMLTLSTVIGETKVAGLDPYLGFLHEIAPARPSLALDILEPLRASVDFLVLTILQHQLRPEDFTQSASDGCRLTKTGRIRFYSIWNQCTEHWPLPPPLLMPTTRENTLTPMASNGADRSLKQICRALIQHFLTQLNPQESSSCQR